MEGRTFDPPDWQDKSGLGKWNSGTFFARLLTPAPILDHGCFILCCSNMVHGCFIVTQLPRKVRKQFKSFLG